MDCYFLGEKFLNDNNIISIIQKETTIYNKIKNFIIFTFKLLTQKKNLHKLTNNYYTAAKLDNIFDIITKKLKFKNNCKFFIPYESQPFQNNFVKKIKSLKNNYKIYGYIHSFPAFPSHLARKAVNPDFIIVNSKDQLHSFTNFLKWDNKEIILLPSIRFKKHF